MKELSILIPARNEEFLKRTLEDLLTNIEADTEIIVVLDGYETELPKDERIRIIHNPESIGQRAATNQACRLSKATYIMKVDAHCAFDKGFDRKMIEKMQDNWTMIPVMRNLHAFNLVCPLGHTRYQGPSGPCTECGQPTTKDVVWIPKTNPQSVSYRFDSEPHFQYFNEFKKRPEFKKDLAETGLTETMSIQGSCFMLTREKYWELDICDEAFGSWGSQGIEVACKTWLSGGRVVVNHSTWYAHMFRTQGGDFGFPYPLSGEQTNKAKSMSKQIWFDNLWPKQERPLSWLLEKFWPIPGWTEEQFKAIKAWPLPQRNNPVKRELTAGIVYYTDNRLDPKIMKQCQEEIKKSGLPIVSVSLKPIDFGTNIVMNLERGPITMFKQILAGLEKLDTDVVFLCEHDVLYHPSHFIFRPERKDLYYYNMNNWQLRSSDGHAVAFDAKKVSQLCADWKLLLEHYRRRLELIEKRGGFDRKMGFEPGTHNRDERVDDIKAGEWRSEYPNVDIKHGKNLTEARWHQSEFRSQRSCRNWKETDEIEGWGKGISILKAN